MWYYNTHTGLWSSNIQDFYALATVEDLIPFLGGYATMVCKLLNMQKLLTGQPALRAGAHWTHGLNGGLVAGEVPCHDKIYNALTHESRPITSGDMLTFKMPWNAPNSNEEYETALAAVWRMICEIFPEEGLRNHVMEHMAESLLTPGNPNKYFVQMIGSGNNAKTFLFKVMQIIFKDWIAMPDPKHFIVQKGATDADQATPWLVDLMGARIVVTEEPPQQTGGDGLTGSVCYVDGSLLKRIRGDNLMHGRLLHKNPIKFTPKFTVFICTNKLIEVSPHDQAISDSFISYRMPSIFLERTKLAEARRGEGQNKDDEHLFLRDDTLKMKFEDRDYQLAMLHLLGKYLQTYTVRGGFTDEPSKYLVAKAVYEQAVASTLHELFHSQFLVEPLPLTLQMPRTLQKKILEILEPNGFPVRCNRHLSLFLTKNFKDRRRNSSNVPVWVGITFNPPFGDGATTDDGASGGGGEGSGG